MAWLVTGGAGYIGSHVVREFLSAGLEPVVIDDLSSGHASFVPEGVRFVQASLLDDAALRDVLSSGIDGVVHLAGYKYAGESVKVPLHTYEQNVTATVRLLAAMADASVSRIVFSSSAAVYGTPSVDQVTEATPTAPESPYGQTKLIGEWLVADQAKATGLTHTSLRYFNVVGSGDAAVRDTSPHNLFPLVFRALSAGNTPSINGDDYPTPDGTCVRDYVHVSDIARAHVAAAKRMLAGEPIAPVYNLGAGDGTSVRQIMTVASKVTGIEFEPEIRGRRAGDPARIVASGEQAAKDLGWSNTHDLESMMSSAWNAWQMPLVS